MRAFKYWGPYIFLAAIIVCIVGGMTSCEEECRSHGGVLVRGVFGYECVKGIRR